MNIVRIGIIGYGNMGSYHARNIISNKISRLVLAAVCDINPEMMLSAKSTLNDSVEYYSNSDDLIASGNIDAVLICTPHYSHPKIALKARAHNLHVLVEKPAGVYTRQVREMNDAFRGSNLVFSIMYNQRTNPIYIKLREMILNGDLGEIRRTNWIITDWYRTQSYYDSSSWRATWSGEGGGVLLNQDPHQLDLLLWITDLIPKRIRAFCSFGKMHDIEVEDDVTAYIEYSSGATGLFITSTFETPGTNRFEISGDMGKIIIENNVLTFYKNSISERDFNENWDKGFGSPEFEKIIVPVSEINPQHIGILQNFTDAILDNAPLIAPGEEGIKGLELSNSIHLSTWLDDWVSLPINENLFYEQLQDRCDKSTFTKKSKNIVLDINKSQ